MHTILQKFLIPLQYLYLTALFFHQIDCVETKTGDLKTAEEENQTLTNNKIKMMVFKYHPTAQRESENLDRCFVFSKKVLRSGKIQTFLFLPIY